MKSNKKIKVLFVAPTQGNGGIASWAASYRLNIPSYVELISIGVSKRRSKNVNANIGSRLFNGILDMIDVFIEINRTLKTQRDINIVHVTTSGSFGVVRDYFIAKIAKIYNVETILHCHYGSIWSDVSQKIIYSWLLKNTLGEYDQLWILDRRTIDILNADCRYKGKVRLAPNFIVVPELNGMYAKSFKRVGFVGNLIPTKGIYELVEAVASMDNNTILDIIGPGKPSVIEHIKELAGDKLNKTIFLHGRLDNNDAIKFIEKLDIIALPTYYPFEAFPISILEAMSHGKIVISCDRGAIRDMLTSENGKSCGLLVEPKKSTDIKESITWCQNNCTEANNMCVEAYEKVKSKYRTDIVINQYIDNYNILESSL